MKILSQTTDRKTVLNKEFTATLTGAELYTLGVILRCVGGDPDSSLRKFVDSILCGIESEADIVRILPSVGSSKGEFYSEWNTFQFLDYTIAKMYSGE